MLSIRISEVNGQVVKSIINVSWSTFLKKLVQLGLVSVPAAFCNSLIDYYNKKIALRFRENLTNYFNKHYLNDMMFYHVGAIDARISNPAQRLTQDLDKWATSLSSMYSNLSKPILDIILFSRKLSQTLGWQGPLYILGYYFGATVILKYISPSFGKLVAVEQKLEGEFRACHTNVHHHSEEIAFYRGDKWEKKKMNESFNNLYDHSLVHYNKRMHMGIFDGMLIKYGALMVGYGVLGIPVFGAKNREYLKTVGDSSNITRDYIKNSSLLISLAKALGRIVISYKDIQELAGYTTCVYEVKDVIDDIKKGFYSRQIPSSTLKNHNIHTSLNKKGQEMIPMRTGEVEISNCIMMDDVPLIAPNGDELATNISLLLQQGMSCLVVGPNGCGKTSLFRILASAWPTFGGKIQRPPLSEIVYLPQRAYLPKGTLRDLVTYPDLKSKLNDAEILDIIANVKLEHLVEREGGLDSKNDWVDLLSGGERQRISFARLFYHKPTFAILDEATSAVSIDFEGILYLYAKKKNITFFTVSQRNTLYEYHDYLLKFDGQKHWTFEQIIHN